MIKDCGHRRQRCDSHTLTTAGNHRALIYGNLSTGLREGAHSGEFSPVRAVSVSTSEAPSSSSTTPWIQHSRPYVIHMGVDMQNNKTQTSEGGGKVRAVPLYRLKNRGVPLQTEEGLIYAVFKRKPLWDPSVHFYRNNTVIKILWEEVANETGLTDIQAKGRWKSLRDYYRLELKKLQKTGEESKKSNWIHFSSMSFLKELMSSKKDEDLQHGEDSMSSVEEPEQSTDSEDVFIKDEESKPPCWRPLIGDSPPTFHRVSSPPAAAVAGSVNLRQNPDIFRKVILDMERRRLELLEKRAQMEEDDDLQYLKSLLPLIKSLPLSKRIGVRLKFQEIICNEIEQAEKKEIMAQ